MHRPPIHTMWFAQQREALMGRKLERDAANSGLKARAEALVARVDAQAKVGLGTCCGLGWSSVTRVRERCCGVEQSHWGQ